MEESMEMEKRSFKSGSFLKGILIGSILAGVVALFTAPRSGAETRQMLGEKGAQLRDNTLHTIDDVRAQITTAIEGARQQAGQVIQRTGEQLGSQAHQK